MSDADFSLAGKLPLPYSERHLPYKDRRGAQVWPDGARLAVYTYIAAEEWLWDRKENHFPAFTRQVPGEPAPNLATRSAVKYGFDIGLRRLSDVLDERNIKVSFVLGAAAAEQHEEVVSEFARAGHDVVAHTYSQGTPTSLMDKETQRVIIKETVSLIEKVVGKKPLGWVSPGGACTVDTIQLLAEEGFLYDCDLQDDELPYFIDIDGRTLVEVPSRVVGHIVDYFYAVPGRSPDDAFAFIKSAFDAYYQESLTRPLQFNLGTHPFVSGRPDYAAVLGRFLDYASKHEGVWMTTHQGIAEWWSTRFGKGYSDIR